MAGWETYFERLGPQGLRLVVAGVLDDDAAQRVAGRPLEGATPGERARALVDLVAEEPERGPLLLEALDAAEPDTDRRDEGQVHEDLAAALRAPDPGAARLLHHLARPARPSLAAAEIRAAAEVLADAVLGEDPGTRPKWMARSAADRAGVRERALEQDRRELEARVRQLEAQATRLVQRSADLEQELAARLSEIQQLRLDDRAAREERKTLERELARLEKRIEEFKERRARENTGVVTTALRRLTTEQRRAVAQLDKLRKADADRREALREQNRRIAALADLVEKVGGQREAELRAAAAAQETILRELADIRNAIGQDAAGRAARASGDALPRVGLFVDVQNMFYGARERNARVDFEALLAAASDGRQLARAVAYVVETRDIDQSAFIHLLQVKKYEVKRKALRIRPDGSMKGNWDLEMALDALTTAEHLDVVVLATGDGDFLPLVRQLKLRGLTVEVYGFPRSSAPDLREAADRFVAISRRMLRPLATERKPRPGAPAAAARPAAPEVPPEPAPAASAREPEAEPEPDHEDEPAAASVGRDGAAGSTAPAASIAAPGHFHHS